MTEYSTQNSRRLERYYEKSGRERALNPPLFDRRVMKGYDILKRLLAMPASEAKEQDMSEVKMTQHNEVMSHAEVLAVMDMCAEHIPEGCEVYREQLEQARAAVAALVERFNVVERERDALLTVRETLKRECKALKAENARIAELESERNIAVRMLAEWCVAVDQGGASWDEWDEHYKEAAYRPGPLRTLIDTAIYKVKMESGDA